MSTQTDIIFTEGDAMSGEEPMPLFGKITTVYDPQNDSTPGIVLGVQAILGSVWWVLTCFLYIKNQSGDDDLRLIGNGSVTVPIMWWWERISQQGGGYNWHAAALMSTFFAFFIVSFTEMIAWFTYIDGYYEFARWYFSTIGYWMSIFTYIIPFVLEIVHLYLKGSIIFPGTWAIYHMLGSLCFWILAGVSHIIYIDDFISFIDAREPSNCVCDAPEVLTISPDADEETRLAWKFATDQRKIVCEIECPLLAIARQCKLKRLPQQSDQEYTEACNAVIDRVNQNNRARKALEEEQAAEQEGLETADVDEEEATEAEEEIESEGW